jgi:site-specific DNA-cytosine methylase
MINNYTYASIIPLIGGMTLAMEKSFKCEPKYIVSYKPFKNNDSHILNYFNNKIPYYLIDEITNELNIELESIDVVTSLCPCAGLSMLNSSNRGEDAPQNQWLYKSTEFVLKNIKPKVLFGENAPNLFTKSGEKVKNNLINFGKNYGYSFSLIKTNTRLHGIPQERIRTFYFFWKSDSAPILDWIDISTKTLKDYLNEISKDSLYYNEYVSKEKLENNKLYIYMKQKFPLNFKEIFIKYKSVLSYAKKENQLDDIINFIEKNFVNNPIIKKLYHVKNKLKLGKNYWDFSPIIKGNYSQTITGRSFGNIIHPEEERYINFRECMHLMGLPEDFKVEIDNKIIMHHITQNVPVNSAYCYAEQIKKYLNNELSFSNKNVLFQNNINQKFIY